MKSTLTAIALSAWLAAPVFAQDEGEVDDTPAPTQAAPGRTPPPPPAELPPPPNRPESVSEVQDAPEDEAGPPGQGADGQWTYTNQYGWIWTPYSEDYTYVNPAGELAFTYAYYPHYGWRWLPSPWVLGFGPHPYWGRGGYGHFAWYSHPWFHAGVYRPNVWNSWHHGYAHGFVYGRGYAPHPAYVHGGRVVVAHPMGHPGYGHVGGHRR